MPYTIRKLPNQNLYRVYNSVTKEIHSYATTLENAKKQVKLLHMIDAGVPLQPSKNVTLKEQMKRVEISGGNLEKDDELLKPFFSRVGGKKFVLKYIIPLIPPHTTYVEAFVGGGALFWNKIPAKKSVINDLDKELIEGYKLLKKIPSNADLSFLDNAKQVSGTYPEIEKFINSITSNSSDVNKLVAYFKKNTGTFGATGFGKIYGNALLERKMKHIDEYKKQLLNTTIMNKNYIKIINQFDSPNTFFFLDPPYEDSDGLYKHDTIDYEEMRDTLKLIKGKFLLTINDSKYIRDIFKDFNQKKILVKNFSKNFDKDDRKELFITNYH